ncbi:MAG: methionine--tRNA ligase [candidate division Zixibacteria bacterium]|nr:methionine--tRNA ligase [candidate division Zixibacteria bacterium]
MPNDKRPIYFTTPIYYVNDKPHIGHAYTTIVADYLARANRVLGRPAFFLTGTDEHGARIAEVAREHGRTPQEWCDEHSEHFKAAWKALSIEYDDFIRTTDKRHEAGVQIMLDRMHKAKTADGQPVLYEAEYTGLYCMGCEKYITERELVEGRCPLHPNRELRQLTEKNYFFRLSSYLKEVEAMIQDGRITIRPDERRKEVLGLLKYGLEDFSASREKVDWGVPLPFDPSQNAYVWVDALPNYITAIGFGADEAKFTQWWTEAESTHLLGKDILKFHAIFWPAMLLSIGEAVPEHLFIHGYFTVNGQKMSKSLGNVIDPHALVKAFGPDGTRHLLLTQFQFGQDGDVKAEEFLRQFNADLANDVGNLVSRAVKLIDRHFDGQRPEVGAREAIDDELREAALTAVDQFDDGVGRLIPNDAILAALNLSRAANRYMEQTAPWNLAKSGDTDRLGTVLATVVEAIRVSAVLLSPGIPNKARQILKALGFTKPEDELSPDAIRGWDRCPGPFTLPESIFPRLDKAAIDLSGKKEEPKQVAENVISIDQFFETQLRTAKVLEAEAVKGAKKLLKLQIEVGTENRQIVAGIAEHYKPEDLIGRTIVVVANLQPAKIRGVESNGMLLAASNGKTLRLVTADGEIPSGSKVG